MSTIRTLCDRCIVLDEGRVIYDGEVEKAIEFYMGADSMLKSYMEYSLTDYTSIMNGLFQIKSIQLNHKDCQYNSNEAVELKMCCESMQPLPRLSFCFQFVAADNTRIGSAICSDIISIDRANLITATLPISMLSPGEYLIEVAIHSGSPYDDGCYINTLKKVYELK